MIKSFRHAGIVVEDLDRALAFWCEVLGFRVQRKILETGSFIDTLLGMRGVQVTTTKLAGPDGNQVELLKFHSHPSLSTWQGTPWTAGLTHLAFTVSDLDSLCARLTDADVTLLAMPQITPDGSAKVLYARGPENILLEFVEMLGK